MKKIQFSILFCCLIVGANAQTLTVKNGAIFSVNNNSTTPVLTVNGGITHEGSFHLSGTVQNTADAALSGTLNVPLGGATVGTDYDQIVSGGVVSIGSSTLTITLENSYVPTIGASFTLLDGASLTGTFTTVNLPNLPNDRIWQQVYNPTNGTYILTVTTVLPVELLVFKGYYLPPSGGTRGATEGGNLLIWQTAEEVNNSHFDIQASPDPSKGGEWRTVGTVSAKGSNSTYEFLDKAPLWGVGGLYYRLKINDLDTKFEFSKTITIENKRPSTVRIYPSVTSDFLTIENVQSFQIVNMAGQIVADSRRDFDSNKLFESRREYDLSPLPNGIYVVKGLDTEGVLFSQKIVKQ